MESRGFPLPESLNLYTVRNTVMSERREAWSDCEKSLLQGLKKEFPDAGLQGITDIYNTKVTEARWRSKDAVSGQLKAQRRSI